ncbi:MAG: hypothetical protein ACRDQW_01050 [Haloechinothrix sp.]
MALIDHSDSGETLQFGRSARKVAIWLRSSNWVHQPQREQEGRVVTR